MLLRTTSRLAVSMGRVCVSAVAHATLGSVGRRLELVVGDVTRGSARQALVETEIAVGSWRWEIAVLRRGEVALLQVMLVWRERLSERLRRTHGSLGSIGAECVVVSVLRKRVRRRRGRQFTCAERPSLSVLPSDAACPTFKRPGVHSPQSGVPWCPLPAQLPFHVRLSRSTLSRSSLPSRQGGCRRG